MCHLLDLRFSLKKKIVFLFFDEDLMKIEEREKRKKNSSNKNKNREGSKEFSNCFFLLNKIKECEYVEFCAPPRYFFFFLRWCVSFFSPLLILLILLDAG